MSIGDADTAGIRSTRTYRAAVWSARLACVYAGAWGWMLWAASPSGFVIFLTWLVGLPPLVCAVMLLRRSGVRFARGLTPWQVEDAETRRQFYLDVFWLRLR